MSGIIRKPNDFNEPIDPITPARIASTPEDERLLRDLRRDTAGYEEFDPSVDRHTSTLSAVSPRQTSGSMGIIPPHTRYLIRPGDFDIFAEIQGALCNHLRLGHFPGPVILPRPSYEKLAWDRLTTKPFNGKYPFTIDRMIKPLDLPVYQDSNFIYRGKQYMLILPHDVILCLIL